MGYNIIYMQMWFKFTGTFRQLALVTTTQTPTTTAGGILKLESRWWLNISVTRDITILQETTY